MDPAIAASVFIVIYNDRLKRRRKPRRHWVTPILRRRESYGGESMLNDLRIGGQFENFCRMSSEDFEYLLNLIGPEITRRDTNYRKAISAKDRLAITVRFLATGDSFTSLMYLFKVSKQSISYIVMEVCRALNNALRDYIQVSNIVY